MAEVIEISKHPKYVSRKAREFIRKLLDPNRKQPTAPKKPLSEAKRRELTRKYFPVQE